MAESVADFLARGGKIQVVDEGVSGVSVYKELAYYSELIYCDCGCEGDYTAHTMRLGEKGIYNKY